jgi:hypothetical protein
MPKASVQSVADSFYTSNFRAARIIAAEPERYAGIMLEWARAVIAKAPRPKRADEGIVHEREAPTGIGGLL